MKQDSLLARQIDDHRRLTMPPECPPNSAVTVWQVDENTWLVRRQVKRAGVKMVTIPVLERLRDDPAWEKKERALAKELSANLPPFER